MLMQGVDISITVCNFVSLCVCTFTDLSAEDKASGVKFCTAIHRRTRQGISHLGELELKIGRRIGQRAHLIINRTRGSLAYAGLG